MPPASECQHRAKSHGHAAETRGRVGLGTHAWNLNACVLHKERFMECCFSSSFIIESHSIHICSALLSKPKGSCSDPANIRNTLRLTPALDKLTGQHCKATYQNISFLKWFLGSILCSVRPDDPWLSEDQWCLPLLYRARTVNLSPKKHLYEMFGWRIFI